MGFVYDATTDRSDYVILDAHDFTGAPVATVHLPHGCRSASTATGSPTHRDRYG